MLFGVKYNLNVKSKFFIFLSKFCKVRQNYVFLFFYFEILMNVPKTHTLATSRLIVLILWDPTYAPVSQQMGMERHADNFFISLSL